MSWRDAYYEEGYLRRWALQAPGDEEFRTASALLELSGVRSQGRVLDLACGHGRYALALSRHAAFVVGLDASGALLRRARSFQHALSLPVAWVRGDMQRIPFTCTFDLVLIIDAFGNTDEDAAEHQVLREVRRVLGAGGRLLMRNPNGAVIRDDFRPTQEEQREDRITSIRSVLDAKGHWLDQWVKVEDESGSKEYRRRQRIYSASELSQYLTGVGFQSIEHYSSLDGAEFHSSSSPKMITVARLA